MNPKAVRLLETADPRDAAGPWSVRLTGGGHHVNHVHPAGRITSAFYASLPEAAMGRRAPPGLAGAGRSGRARARPCADPAGRAEAGPAGALPLDDVARHAAPAAGERLTMAFDIARPRQ
jgi:hypothetical protein